MKRKTVVGTYLYFGAANCKIFTNFIIFKYFQVRATLISALFVLPHTIFLVVFNAVYIDHALRAGAIRWVSPLFVLSTELNIKNSSN